MNYKSRIIRTMYGVLRASCGMVSGFCSGSTPPNAPNVNEKACFSLGSPVGYGEFYASYAPIASVGRAKARKYLPWEIWTGRCEELSYGCPSG